MIVRAKEAGFDGRLYREPGDVFDCVISPLPHWVEAIDAEKEQKKLKADAHKSQPKKNTGGVDVI